MWLIDVIVSFARNIKPRIREWRDERTLIGESIYIELEKLSYEDATKENAA